MVSNQLLISEGSSGSKQREGKRSWASQRVDLFLPSSLLPSSTDEDDESGDELKKISVPVGMWVSSITALVVQDEGEKEADLLPSLPFSSLLFLFSLPSSRILIIATRKDGQ